MYLLGEAFFFVSASREKLGKSFDSVLNTVPGVRLCLLFFLLASVFSSCLLAPISKRHGDEETPLIGGRERHGGSQRSRYGYPNYGTITHGHSGERDSNDCGEESHRLGDFDMIRVDRAASPKVLCFVANLTSIYVLSSGLEIIWPCNFAMVESVCAYLLAVSSASLFHSS